MRAVNLLPADRRERRSSNRVLAAGRNPAILAVAALAVVVLAGIGTMSHSASASVSAKQARLDALQQQLDAMPAPAAVSGELATATARLNAVGSAASGRLPFDALLAAFSRVIPEDVWLLSLQATSPSAGPTDAAAAAATPAPAVAGQSSLFTINGYTYSQPSVARLMKRLTLVPWLTNVQLQSSVMAEINKRRVYQFTVGADVLNSEVPS
jgi:Tfp pilus assembly protein PilN